jgi:hypothetical protein
MGSHPRVVKQPKQRVITLPKRRVAFDLTEDFSDFILLQIFRHTRRLALERDREDRFALRDVPRVSRGEVLKKGVDRCQPVVAGMDAVLSLALQVLQKAANGLGSDVVQCKSGAGLSVMFAGELEQQFPGIAIGKNGMAAQAPGRDQVLLEEAAD